MQAETASRPTRSAASEAWRNYRLVRIARARENVNDFIELVLHDERTGKEIRQSPIHTRWHRLADRYKRLILWSHPGAGKTQNLAVGRMLWLLGRDPTLRLALVSNTAGQAEKLLGAIRQHIEKSPEYRQVFPRVRPDRSKPWRQNSLYIERPTYSKDPSIQAIGIDGKILGARIDGMVLDDVVDLENSRTIAQRNKLAEWFYKTADTRLEAGGFIITVGNAFHSDDLLHRLAKNEAWHAERFPVLDAKGEPTWPERWPMDRIEAVRGEMPPLFFAQQYLCTARDDASAAFKRDWVDACLKRGETDRYEGWHTVPRDQLVSLGTRCMTGVDLAISKHDAADLTVLFTIMVYPNGDRRVLSIEADRMSFPETVDRMKQVYGRYGGIFVVENNAYQNALVQHMQSSTAIPVFGFTTGTQKSHPELGVPGLAMEFHNAKWIVPSNGGLHPQVRSWLDEMLYYDPAAHTGDRLMASWLAVQGIGMTSGREVTVRNLNTR